MCGETGEKYSASALDFVLQYERARPRSAHDPALTEDGFRLYSPTGKLWASEVSADAIAKHFPAGQFIARWGSVMLVDAAAC